MSTSECPILVLLVWFTAHLCLSHSILYAAGHCVEPTNVYPGMFARRRNTGTKEIKLSSRLFRAQMAHNKVKVNFFLSLYHLSSIPMDDMLSLLHSKIHLMVPPSSSEWHTHTPKLPPHYVKGQETRACTSWAGGLSSAPFPPSLHPPPPLPPSLLIVSRVR